MKAILLDTSYVLPLFGVDVHITNISRQLLAKLWKNGILETDYYISDITLLEILYKLNREFRIQGDLDILKRYSQVLPTLLNIPFVQHYYSKLDPLVIDYANSIRQIHTDYLDCIIAGTAYRLRIPFITEDLELQKKLMTIDKFSNMQIMNLFQYLHLK